MLTQNDNWFVRDELERVPERLRKLCEVVGPERLGTQGRAYGISGLRVGPDLLGYYPWDGWKIVNRLLPEPVDDLTAYLGRRLSELDFSLARHGRVGS